jgi:hypothetical protein
MHLYVFITLFSTKRVKIHVTFNSPGSGTGYGTGTKRPDPTKKVPDPDPKKRSISATLVHKS